MSLTRIRGSVWDSADNIVVNVINNLYDSKIKTEGIIFVSGSVSVNDGSGGWYKWEATTPKSSANGYSIVNPALDNTTGNGCWIRQNFTSMTYGGNTSEVQIAALGQTVFQIHNFVYEPDQGELAIYVNGIRLIPNAFEETNANTITLAIPLRAEDEVEIIAHEHPEAGQDVCTKAAEVCYDNTDSALTAENVQDALNELAAREGTPGTRRDEVLWISVTGQDTFTFNNNPNALDVFLNGVKLDPQEDYSATSEGFVLTVPIQSADDRLIAQSYTASEDYYPTFYQRVSWASSAGISVFSWSHDPSNLNLFLNGSRLIVNVDYTTNGSQITLSAALLSDSDILEGFSFTTFNVADAVSQSQYDTEQAVQNARLDAIEAALP